MKPLAVMTVSGGMDSSTLPYLYREQFDLLMVGVNYGQRHSKELESHKAIAEAVGARSIIVDLSNLTDVLHGSSLTSGDVEVPDGHYAEETMKATVVPNRNAILFSIASGIAVAEKGAFVAVGVHAGDHFIYPDCRPQFFNPFSQAIAAGNEGFAEQGFHLEAPFISMSKTEIAKLGSELGVPYELTWSCYKGGEVHCGTCGTCTERKEAFNDAGVPDPTEYAA